MIKDLNVSNENIKTLEENIGSKILDISHSNIFQIYLLGQGKHKQIGLHKIKNLLHGKENPQ